LKKKKLKDTVVVITRYFGGIKLGAGGLIRAYGKATSEGLETAGIVERRLVQVIHVKIDYTWLGKVEKELRLSTFIIKEINYLDHVVIEVYVDTEQGQAFIDWMVDLTNGSCNFTKGENVYLEEEKSTN
jgi:putative IMPACT (imprinted ancient) family translation regulator